MIGKKCNVCDNDLELFYNKETNQRIADTLMCYKCLFWNDIYVEIEYPNLRDRDVEDIWISPEYEVYYVMEDDPDEPDFYKGYGGREIVAVKHGKEVRSNNVWNRGKLPEFWWGKVTPNISSINV